MHRSKDESEPIDAPEAFEYVLGTLSPEEREHYLKKRSENPALKADQLFWEEQLQSLQSGETLTPQETTWKKIEQSINTDAIAHPSTRSAAQTTIQTTTQSKKSESKKSGAQALISRWQQWLPWSFSGIAASCLLFLMLTGDFTLTQDPNKIPVDYIAVLTGSDGKAKLSAVTHGKDQAMWLQWEAVELAPDKDLQLWAISRSDGETRSLVVIEEVGLKRFALNEANWRLVKDAELLILTEEEEGGSAFDEPSEQIIAKGYCIRIENNEASS